MSIIAIIPARGGSKGIPRKNLIPFVGHPLLYWSVDQALKSKSVDAVYVTSDDDEILDAAKAWGVRGIRRPSSIAGDQATSESALLHVLDNIDEDPLAVVFLQATSPLRRPGDIDGAVQKYLDSGADTLFSGVRLEDFIVWHRTPDTFDCLNFDWRTRQRRQDHGGVSYVENGSIYLFPPALLRQTNNRLGGEIEVFEMETWQSFEIDEQSDVKLCELLFQHYLGMS